MRYSQHVSKLETRQTEQAREDQVLNNAGGYVFQVDDWARLDRFLILGSEGGTYYVDEKKLTKQNAACISRCIAADGPRTVKRIVEISDSGRAPKNDPAIFALAVCAGASDVPTRQAALAALPKVCRIGTHLFHFAADVEHFRRWGRSLRRAVANWYTERPVDSLALQAVKYQQRDGWSHRDLLRLSHPITTDKKRNAAFRWMTGGRDTVEAETKKQGPLLRNDVPEIILAFDKIQKVGVKEAVNLIRDFKLPHECVPNELKGNPEIWEALSEDMGITALIRNLGKMTSVGAIAPLSKTGRSVAAKLRNEELLQKGRVHPIAILTAMKVYAMGRGVKGNLTWTPVREILDALDDAFYASFKNVRPTGKRILLALDVSGSMGGGYGDSILSPREITAAMAMVTARTEPVWHCIGFSGGIRPLTISPRQRLDDIVRSISNLPFDTTDCALPMLWAARNRVDVDAFTVWTDNETHFGSIHPFQALKEYREMTGIGAKLAVCATAATNFTIADPSDAGTLDLVGFDASVPEVLSDFISQ